MQGSILNDAEAYMSTMDRIGMLDALERAFAERDSCEEERMAAIVQILALFPDVTEEEVRKILARLTEPAHHTDAP